MTALLPLYTNCIASVSNILTQMTPFSYKAADTSGHPLIDQTLSNCYDRIKHQPQLCFLCLFLVSQNIHRSNPSR